MCDNCSTCCDECVAIGASVGQVVAAAILSPVLIALVVGGVIATILFSRKDFRSKTRKKLSFLWKRTSHSFSVRFNARNAAMDIENPTYETDVPMPTSAPPPEGSSTSQTTYEPVFTRVELERNYDIIREETEEDTGGGDRAVSAPTHKYDSVTLDEYPRRCDYDNILNFPAASTSNASSVPSTTAYAVADVSESKPPESKPMSRINSIEASRKSKKNEHPKKSVPSSNASSVPSTTAYAVADVSESKPPEPKPIRINSIEASRKSKKNKHPKKSIPSSNSSSIPSTTAYAVADVSDSKPPESKPMIRINSLEASRKFTKKNGQTKKPIPTPKPKNPGASGLTSSTTVPKRTYYSHLDPSSKSYAQLEPHIQSLTVQGPSSVENPKEYSHLTR